MLAVLFNADPILLHIELRIEFDLIDPQRAQSCQLLKLQTLLIQVGWLLQHATLFTELAVGLEVQTLVHHVVRAYLAQFRKTYAFWAGDLRGRKLEFIEVEVSVVLVQQYLRTERAVLCSFKDPGLELQLREVHLGLDALLLYLDRLFLLHDLLRLVQPWLDLEVD